MSINDAITPTAPQYVVFFDHPEARGIHSVRYLDGTRIGGVQVAAHERLQSVRHAIPMTHERAPFAQEAPIVEVWVLKKFIDSPPADNPYKSAGERYPRGWHPDDEGHG